MKKTLAATAALAAAVSALMGCSSASPTDDEVAVEQCKQGILDKAKDPASVQFGNVTVGQPSRVAVVRTSDSPEEDVSEWRGGGMVNAKNSYGGYTGDQPFTCYATKYDDGTWSHSATIDE